VSEAAVIGVKDDKWGERPLALIVRDARTGDDLGDTQIKEHLKAFADAGVISKYGIPDEILFVKALPKTSVGKVDKKALRETHGKL
jgi:fatty-acyl-CoA synthase